MWRTEQHGVPNVQGLSEGLPLISYYKRVSSEKRNSGLCHFIFRHRISSLLDFQCIGGADAGSGLPSRQTFHGGPDAQ